MSKRTISKPKIGCKLYICDFRGPQDPFRGPLKDPQSPVKNLLSWLSHSNLIEWTNSPEMIRLWKAESCPAFPRYLPNYIPT